MTDEIKYAINHLEALRQEVRDEIKLRIEQRDKYSIQLTVALSALLALSVTNTTNQVTVFGFTYRILLAAPLVSIYFTTLILYSYRIHKLMAKYLREEIEPELSQLCGTVIKKEWEHYYQNHAVPGIRKSFFLGTLWLVCIGSSVFIGFLENWQGDFIAPLVTFSTVYLLATIWITIFFWKS